jgi:hypothetical protein
LRRSGDALVLSSSGVWKTETRACSLADTLVLVKANRWAVAAFVAAVVGALVASFAPLGRSCTIGPSPDAGEACRRVSTFSEEGAWVLVVVSVPVLVALMAVVVHRRSARVASAVLLWVGCIMGLASVGIFFAPAAIIMTVAAAVAPPPPRVGLAGL